MLIATIDLQCLSAQDLRAIAECLQRGATQTIGRDRSTLNEMATQFSAAADEETADRAAA